MHYHILILCVALTFVIAAACLGDPLPQPARETFNCSTDGTRWPYLVQAPVDAGRAVEPRAILIYLHGHYSDETQGMTEGAYNDTFGKLRRECLRRQWAYVSAYYGGNSWMGPLGEAGLVDLINILKARWPNHPVYLCGGSMGGSSTLVFATVRPELLAGAIALCPAADIEGYYRLAAEHKDGVLANIAAAIRIHYTTDGHQLEAELHRRSALVNADRLTMRLFISHGAKDGLIPVAAVRALAAKLHDLGRPVSYVELPEGDHDAPAVQMDWAAALDFVSQPAKP